MMSALLTQDQAQQLALLSAITTDDEAKKRIAAMRAAQEEAENALKRLQVQQQVNQQSIKDAQGKLTEAATMAANAEAKMREADAREKKLGEMQDALTAEKRAFEGVRQQVDAQQKAQADHLNAAAATLKQREQDVADLMTRNTQRSADLDALQERLDKAVERLTAAIQGLKA